jgi:predicted dehydrogenase
MSLAYKDGAMANLNCTFMAHTNTEAKIYGDLGKIEVYGQWFRPSSIKLSLNDGWSEELTFPVKANGYEYEAIEVINCLRNGVSESDVLSLDFSLLLMKLLDDIRKQCNIIYPLYDK